MPKPRKRNTKELKKRIIIYCEGAKGKSEHAYLNDFKKSLKLPASIDIIIEDTKKNTGRELVEEAIRRRENIDDEMWVVYDKDGYPLHPEAFELARIKNIKIAFSAISFEVWILLHIAYTTKAFAKSEDVIRHIRDRHSFSYQKNDTDIFTRLKALGFLTEHACTNAKKLRAFLNSSCSAKQKRPYDMDMYTDLDLLIERIIKEAH